MGFWSDLLGTVNSTFSIGLKKAKLQTTSITAERTFEFPDNSGTLALTSDIGAGQRAPTAQFGDAVNTASVAIGTVAYVRVPYGGTLSAWHIVADTPCSCVIDIWKDTTLPTVANTITAATKPALSSQATASSSALTGWTTSFSEGDIFAFRLDSVSGSPKQITLSLK
jgi:hypothetical protein